MAQNAPTPPTVAAPSSSAETRRWTRQGTALFLEAVLGLDEEEYVRDTLLPGWTRKHLVAHVAANADALVNLVHWAATGEVTPMYASPEERASGIARGPQMSGHDLASWLRQSAVRLEAAMAALGEHQWRAEVMTAQGRTVPASQIPWMRAREVLVHTVDLDRGVRFDGLPADFLEALQRDICHRRRLQRTDLPSGPLPDVTAWLAGRPTRLEGAPVLGPWL